MRKVYRIEELLTYLASIGYPLTEEKIHHLIQNKDFPHLRPYGNLYVFKPGSHRLVGRPEEIKHYLAPLFSGAFTMKKTFAIISECFFLSS